MNPNKKLTEADIIMMPFVTEHQREKPYYWDSIQALVDSVHRNPPRRGDYLRHEDFICKCAYCLFFRADPEYLQPARVEIIFNIKGHPKRQLTVRLVPVDQRGAA